MKVPLLTGLLVVTRLVWAQGIPFCNNFLYEIPPKVFRNAQFPASIQQLPPPAVKRWTYSLPHHISWKVRCFCTAQSFQQTIAPCIAEACEPKDQVQTEQYARGICSIVGVDLPSFRELLSTEVGSTVSASSIFPITTFTNQTLSSFNMSTNVTTTRLPGSTEGTSTTGSVAATGEKSAAKVVEVHVVITYLFTVVLGLGMLLG